jgi:hypothetical protein
MNQLDYMKAYLHAKQETLEKQRQVEPEVQYLQNGGAVIPSGALHKEEHQLEETVPELEGNITKKGIPVISVEDGGEVVQHAEIERNEVIFTLPLTKQIEELWKKGGPAAAIECGKILSEALMTNTDDNTGLIEEVK